MPVLGASHAGLGDLGAWGFIALSLLALGGCAYALGQARARAIAQALLHEARSAAREWRELQQAWTWETDAQHRLIAWQGPAAPPTDRCTLFASDHAPGAAELTRQLRTERAFAGLQLRAEPATEGAEAWVLSGRPRHDDAGRFCGYAGIARPVDAEYALQADAAALPALMAALPGPALLARHGSQGWRVVLLNPDARALWPALVATAPLSEALDVLPPAVGRALHELDPSCATELEAGGWQLRVCPLAAPAAPLLMLTLPAASLLGQAQPSSSLAMQAQQLQAESDTFSFTVSHDLRAPIRVVEGFTRIVKEDYGRLLDRVGNDHLERVLGAAARMNLMIDALLTLARLSSQPLARQPVNLSQLASFVIDDLRRAAPERQAEIEIEPGLTAQGDPTLLRLVLENLLGNAWKYSARCAPARISLSSVVHGAGRALVVRDNGAGFDMRSAERLFGLFQRLHSASEFPGHGVGLASVRRIVLRHGGQIWAEAQPGRGAAFYFTLGS